MFELILQTL